MIDEYCKFFSNGIFIYSYGFKSWEVYNNNGRLDKVFDTKYEANSYCERLLRKEKLNRINESKIRKE